MAYDKNILPVEAAYYTLTNADIRNEILYLQAGGSAIISIDATRLMSIPQSLLVNVDTSFALDVLKPSVIMYLDITMENGLQQQVSIFPNHVENKVLSFPIQLQDGAYSKCELTIKATAPCEVSLYELCPLLESDVTVIIDGVKQSLPHVLYDYNEMQLVVRQDEMTIAMIACSLQGNTDVNGHFTMDCYASEQCDVYLRFYDNEVEELYAPMKYTLNPGYNSIGVPHAYLKRLAGLHTFVVTCQCTNGKLDLYTRDILFTIDAGYLATRLIDVGMSICDISCKHTKLSREPEELWAIGIDAGNLLVKKRDFKQEASSAWSPVYSFKGYSAAVIEFNGVWSKVPKQHAYTIITDEEPYIFAIDMDKNLYVWQGDDEEHKILLDNSVDKVCALRGYSSNNYLQQDQGLICAYIKEGNLYYCSYVYNSKTYAWLPSELLEAEDESIIDVSMHRLNDYRVGIVYSTDTNNYWIISDRTYVSQAVPTEEEEVSPYILSSLISMTPAARSSTLGTVDARDDETIPIHSITVHYDHPIKHRIESYEYDELISKIVKVTINGTVTVDYTLSFVDDTLIVAFKEPIVTTRKGDTKVILSIDNTLGMLYLATTNYNGYVISSQAFEFNIVRSIDTISRNSLEQATFEASLLSGTTQMRQLRLFKPIVEEPIVIQPVSISDVAMKKLSNIPVHPIENINALPIIRSCTVQLIQIGVKPI